MAHKNIHKLFIKTPIDSMVISHVLISGSIVPVCSIDVVMGVSEMTNEIRFICKCGMPCKKMEYLTAHIKNPSRSNGWSDSHGVLAQDTLENWQKLNASKKGKSNKSERKSAQTVIETPDSSELASLKNMLMQVLGQVAKSDDSGEKINVLPTLSGDAKVESAPVVAKLDYCEAVRKSDGKNCTNTNGLNVKWNPAHTVCSAHSRNKPEQFRKSGTVGASGEIVPNKVSDQIAQIRDEIASLKSRVRNLETVTSGLVDGQLDSEQGSALIAGANASIDSGSLPTLDTLTL